VWLAGGRPPLRRISLGSQEPMDPEAPPPKFLRVQFRGVGPLTRSSLPSGPVDPKAAAIDDALHWIWSWRVQVRRLGESQQAAFSASSGMPRRQAESRSSLDEHLLVVTGGNLVRALARASDLSLVAPLEENKHQALWLLRNLYEHWDQQRDAFRPGGPPKEQSGAKFADTFPTGQPWSIVFEEDDWVLANVVPVNELTRELEGIESHLLALDAGP
jgi:hypothetical protein